MLIRDGGSPLYDWRVIVEYLDALGIGPLLIPASERVEVRRLEALADGVLDAGVLIRLESLRPEGERSPAWIERQSDKVRRGLAALSAELGARDWYFAGRLTLADIACGACLGWNWPRPVTAETATAEKRGRIFNWSRTPLRSSYRCTSVTRHPYRPRPRFKRGDTGHSKTSQL